MMTVGTGGFSGSAAATGPVAGFDPVLDFRKKMAKKIKDHPYAQEYKEKRKKAKQVREEIDRHNHQVAHLYQYKVNIPEVGETIIFATSAAELQMKMRLLINPRYRGDVKVERIFPSEAGKFYNEKRIKAYKNLPEATDPEAKDAKAAKDQAAAAQDVAAKKADQMKKQLAQQQVANKIAAEKKKIALKKQQMQQELTAKIAAMKKGASAGQGPTSATEEYIPESSGGNIDAIKKIADSNQPGSIQFLNGEKFQLQPAIAQKIFKAYETLGMQKNKAKFSNAANETTQSFQKILDFVGAAG